MRLIVLAIILLSCQSLLAQSKVRGKLYAQDSVPLFAVHVINSTYNTGTISGNEGFFSIMANKGDTILITCVGFAPHKFAVEEHHLASPITVYLKESAYELETFTVQPFRSKQELADAIASHKTTPPPSFAIPLPPPSYYKQFAPPGIRFDLFKLTHEYAQMQKVVALEEYEAKARMANLKYNKALVIKVTGLDDNDEVEELMAYCNLTVDYVIEHIEYDIIMRVKDCYGEYLTK